MKQMIKKILVSFVAMCMIITSSGTTQLMANSEKSRQPEAQTTDELSVRILDENKKEIWRQGQESPTLTIDKVTSKRYYLEIGLNSNNSTTGRSIEVSMKNGLRYGKNSDVIDQNVTEKEPQYNDPVGSYQNNRGGTRTFEIADGVASVQFLLELEVDEVFYRELIEGDAIKVTYSSNGKKSEELSIKDINIEQTLIPAWRSKDKATVMGYDGAILAHTSGYPYFGAGIEDGSSNYYRALLIQKAIFTLDIEAKGVKLSLTESGKEKGWKLTPLSNQKYQLIYQPSDGAFLLGNLK